MHWSRAHKPFIWLVAFLLPISAFAAANQAPDFPRPLASYQPSLTAPMWQVLRERIQAEPFNLTATVIFFLAIVHTFLAPMFIRLSHRFERKHQESVKARSGE